MQSARLRVREAYLVINGPEAMKGRTCIHNEVNTHTRTRTHACIDFLMNGFSSYEQFPLLCVIMS